MKIIIVSGLSGAGKTVALNTLEDLGYYCIDNLPIALLAAFAAQNIGTESDLYDKVAVGIDARNSIESIQLFPDILNDLKSVGFEAEILFLEADDNILIKRYSETRRRHPLTDNDVHLLEAINRERLILEPVAEHADIHIDTSHTHINQLRDMIRNRIGRHETGSLSLSFLSFGYKHGIPPDADYVFDVRCLPNPHWEPHLRPLTGRDEDVIKYLDSQELVSKMVDEIIDFFEAWIPHFEADNRSYLTLAIGCTGGQHRSVYLVEKLAEHFRGKRDGVMVRHREIVN